MSHLFREITTFPRNHLSRPGKLFRRSNKLKLLSGQNSKPRTHAHQLKLYMGSLDTPGYAGCSDIPPGLQNSGDSGQPRLPGLHNSEVKIRRSRFRVLKKTTYAKTYRHLLHTTSLNSRRHRTMLEQQYCTHPIAYCAIFKKKAG